MRVDREFRRKKVLQKIVVADAVEIRGGIEVFVDDQAVLERDNPTVAARRSGPRVSRIVGARILIVGVVAAEFAAAGVLRTVNPVKLDTESRPALGAVIELRQGVDFVGQRKAITEQSEPAPSRVVARLNVPPRLSERRIQVGKPKDRRLADIKRGIGQNHTVIGIDPGTGGPHLIVGLGAVARGERKGLRLELPQSRRTEAHRREFVNLVPALEVQRLDLALLQIVDRALTIENLPLVVDPDVAGQENLPRLGIVLRVVAINIRSAEMDLHIVFRDGHAALEARSPVGAYLHRRIREVAELGKRRTASRQP